MTGVRYTTAILDELDVVPFAPFIGPNLAELSAALQAIWHKLDQVDVQNLITTIPRHIQAVIRDPRGNTRY